MHALFDSPSLPTASIFPGRYFLNSFGSQACQIGQVPISELRRHDLSLGKGFHWNKIKHERLNFFLSSNYLSSIELSRLDFSSKKSEFQELFSLVFWSLLERDIKEGMSRDLDTRHLINKFIGRYIQNSTLSDFQIRYKHTIHHFYQYFETRLKETFFGSVNQEKIVEKIAKILHLVPTDVWFMLAVAKPQEARANLHALVLKKLELYVSFIELGEMLTLLLLETVQKVELNHLIQLAERDLSLRLKPELAITKIHDAIFREKITQNALDQRDFIHTIMGFDLGVKGNVFKVEISGRSPSRLMDRMSRDSSDLGFDVADLGTANSPFMFSAEAMARKLGFKFKYTKRSEGRLSNTTHSFSLLWP